MIIRMMLALLCAVALPAHAQAVRYIHTDGLGSVVAVTDASRNVIERREYEPFGAQLTPTLQDGPGYTGHVVDKATALLYMQQRYFDPSIGRFLSVDPVGSSNVDGSNFNRYWYGNNNPYNFIDPDGRLGCAASRIASSCASQGMASTSVRSRLDIGANQQSGSTRRGQGNATPTPQAGVQRGDNSAPKGFYGSTLERSTEVEAAVALGMGGRYKRDVVTEKDSLGLVLIGVGAHGRAARAGTIGPSLDLLKGGYAWGTLDAPVDIDFNGKLFVVGLNVNFDPGRRLEASLNWAPASVGVYTGVSIMFDDTIVDD